MSERKEIMLICDPPFFNSVDVQVCDFPLGFDSETPAESQKYRRRCKVTVEFAKSDVEILKRQGLTYEEALNHYKDWLYETIRLHLASDWKCVAGYDELIKLITDKVKRYYME